MNRCALGGIIFAVGLSFAAIEPAEAGYIFAFDVPGGNHLTTDAGTAFTIDSGWYLQTAIDAGRHDATNPSYEVGTDEFPDDVFRDFFVFDISSLTGPVTTASFTVNTAETWLSAAGTPTALLSLFDVSTSINDLEATNSGRGDIWSDLGSGDLYGTQLYTDADSGLWLTITLSPNSVEDLNTAIGEGAKQFAIGGILDAVEIPEPLTASVFGIGLCALVLLRRRRFSASIPSQ
jgi:hypothetical protein